MWAQLSMYCVHKWYDSNELLYELHLEHAYHICQLRLDILPNFILLDDDCQSRASCVQPTFVWMCRDDRHTCEPNRTAIGYAPLGSRITTSYIYFENVFISRCRVSVMRSLLLLMYLSGLWLDKRLTFMWVALAMDIAPVSNIWLRSLVAHTIHNEYYWEWVPWWLKTDMFCDSLIHLCMASNTYWPVLYMYVYLYYEQTHGSVLHCLYYYYMLLRQTHVHSCTHTHAHKWCHDTI